MKGKMRMTGNAQQRYAVTVQQATALPDGGRRSSRGWNIATISSAVFAVVIVVSSFTASDAVAAEPTLFRYRSAAGNKQVWKLQRTLKQEQSEGTSRVSTSMDEKSELLITFQAPLENGETPFRFATRSIVSKWQLGSDGEFVFDSANNANPTGANTVLSAALQPVYSRLIGAELNGAVSQTGRLLRVEGYSELVRDLVAGNILTKELTAGGTDESHRQNLAVGWIVFKDEPVSPGDSWETPVEVSLPGGKMAGGTRTIKFLGMEQVEGKEVAHFTVQTNVSFDIRTEANGYVVTGQLSSSESTGDMFFDVAVGRPVSVALKTRMQGTINVANPLGQSRSVVIDQTSDFSANISDDTSPAAASSTATATATPPSTEVAKDAASTPADGPTEIVPSENGAAPPATGENPPANPNP